jgi:hypothetical protein
MNHGRAFCNVTSLDKRFVPKDILREEIFVNNTLLFFAKDGRREEACIIVFISVLTLKIVQ